MFEKLQANNGLSNVSLFFSFFFIGRAWLLGQKFDGMEEAILDASR